MACDMAVELDLEWLKTQGWTEDEIRQLQGEIAQGRARAIRSGISPKTGQWVGPEQAVKDAEQAAREAAHDRHHHADPATLLRELNAKAKANPHLFSRAAAKKAS